MLDIKPLTGALGAEVAGIDLSRVLGGEDRLRLRKLLNEYQVIFFRDQNISPEAHRALALSFGPIEIHPAYESLDGFPEIAIIESTTERPNRVAGWRSNMTFRPHPPMAAIQKAVVVPARGGDTLWASMSAAYEGLSGQMQSFLEDLTAVHDFSWGFRETLADPDSRNRLAQAVSDNPPVRHPVIRVHPETGKKVIYVNSLYTTHIDGLSRTESEAVLSMLLQHICADEYVCRFQWLPNSVAIWDNRSTQQKPVNDYLPGQRRMERITVQGDMPF